MGPAEVRQVCVLDDACRAIEPSPALFRANRQHVVQLVGQIVIEMQANHVAITSTTPAL